MFRKKTSPEVLLMRRTIMEMIGVIDQLRADNEQLRLRGAKLVESLEHNDGTVYAAWKVSDAVSVWKEFMDVTSWTPPTSCTSCGKTRLAVTG